MSEKFCFSCGEKMPEEYTYCPKCGKSQNNPSGKNGKTALIIIGVVIAAALIALCIIIASSTGNSDEPAYSSSLTFPQTQSVPSDNGIAPDVTAAQTTETTTSKTTASETTASETVKNIAPYGTFGNDLHNDVEKLEQCGALYTNYSDSASVFGIYGVAEGNLNIIACAVIDNSKCKQGFRLSGNGSDTAAYFDIVLTEGNEYLELISANNPELFQNCEFVLESFSENSSATFTLKINFTYDGITYCFEGGATADFQKNDQDISGGGYSDANAGSRMCAACYGKGICSVCDGTGKTHNWDGNKVTCNSCHGTLMCIACNGSGYY